MKRAILIIWFLGLLFVSSASGQSSTIYDVEFSRICLIDSIAPDTLVQFWRFTQSNNPGSYMVDVTYDLSSAYTVEGDVLPCCSCLTELADAGVKTKWETYHWKSKTLIAVASLGILFLIFRIEQKQKE